MVDAVDLHPPSFPAGLPSLWISCQGRLAKEIGTGSRNADEEARARPALRRPRLDHSRGARLAARSEEHTSELQSLMRISYAVFCLKKKNKHKPTNEDNNT